jgi:hypothetical protein
MDEKLSAVPVAKQRGPETQKFLDYVARQKLIDIKFGLVIGKGATIEGVCRKLNRAIEYSTKPKTVVR